MNWNLEEALAYYQSLGAPGDQSALVNLLREIQQEQNGSIPSYLITSVSQAYGIKESLLLAIVRRIPSLRLSDTHCLEICGGPNCSKNKALAAYAEQLQKKRNFTLKFVPCMRLCGKGPNIRWDGTLHHRATEELLDALTASESK